MIFRARREQRHKNIPTSPKMVLSRREEVENFPPLPGPKTKRAGRSFPARPSDAGAASFKSFSQFLCSFFDVQSSLGCYVSKPVEAEGDAELNNLEEE